MNEQAAVIIGASGLIGGHLVEEMLHDSSFSEVRILVRMELPLDHSKLKQAVVDFNDIIDFKNKFGSGDSVFSCIGTTQKKVKGDKDAYEKIDHDIPVNAAGIAIANGFKKFLVVSSAGADATSNNFYLRLKGRTENSLKQFAFKSISIFRPSMLLGDRTESRPAERIVQPLMQGLSFLFTGRLKKYHAIQARDVAKAMIAQSKQDDPGLHILQYQEMMGLIR